MSNQKICDLEPLAKTDPVAEEVLLVRRKKNEIKNKEQAKKRKQSALN